MRWVIEFKYYSNTEFKKLKTGIEGFKLPEEDKEQIAGISGLKKEYPEAQISPFVIYGARMASASLPCANEGMECPALEQWLKEAHKIASNEEQQPRCSGGFCRTQACGAFAARKA